MTDIKETFAFYGFIGCPLTDEQIEICRSKNLDETTTYAIGCDVANGISFNEAVEANTP